MAGLQYVTNPAGSTITSLDLVTSGNTGNIEPLTFHGEHFQIDSAGIRHTHPWSVQTHDSNTVTYGTIGGNLGILTLGSGTNVTEDNNACVDFDGTNHVFQWNGSGNQEWVHEHVRPNGRRTLKVVAGPEETARLLLYRMIGGKAFRGYLRNGFVSYRGKSGKIYQVFPGYGEVQVWQKGQPIERLCLIFKDGKLPPTDSVVMRLLMLENDEEEFRNLSNIHVFQPQRERYTDPVVKPGRILRMAKDKKAGKLIDPDEVVWLKPGMQLTISANTAHLCAIRVA